MAGLALAFGDGAVFEFGGGDLGHDIRNGFVRFAFDFFVVAREAGVADGVLDELRCVAGV